MGSIEERLAMLGPTTFVVQKMGMVMSHEDFMEYRKRKPLDLKSARAVEDGCTLCDKMSVRTFKRISLKSGSRSLRRVILAGTDASYIDIVDLEVAQGRYHSTEDDLYRRQVVYIGDFIREEFFSGVDPIDKTLKIDGKKYTVIGVSEKIGSMMGGNSDNFVLIPLSTFIKQYGEPRRRGLDYMIKAPSIAQLDETMDEVRMILRSRRHVAYNDPDDFSMLTADNILATLNNITRMFRFGLVGISSISLVVGGIVVMNIMMVSVSERTREIGIRKAVGARHRHILFQFLFESLMTTLTGGLIGIVGGYLIAVWLMNMMDVQISPSTFAIVSGLMVSSGIGLIFGIYPAMKAAKLDPIKALSYE